jgi:hypothetical protein
MNVKKLLLVVLFSIAMISSAFAEIKHITMRVEGMT